jgi:kynurenine formamidase
VAYKGKLYNGKSPASVTSRGATLMDITAYVHGIIGRGVLLDIPRFRKVKWLEPGEAVTANEIEAVEKFQGVRLGEGDIFLFRTGHHRRRLELGPWNNNCDGEGQAGLHVNAMPLLHERKVAAFLPDGDGETVPSNVEGVAYPVHALQIASMGMACADNLQFEDLIKICEEEKRWTFMLIGIPLRLPQGTGSLFNPIAIF